MTISCKSIIIGLGNCQPSPPTLYLPMVLGGEGSCSFKPAISCLNNRKHRDQDEGMKLWVKRSMCFQSNPSLLMLRNTPYHSQLALSNSGMPLAVTHKYIIDKLHQKYVFLSVRPCVYKRLDNRCFSHPEKVVLEGDTLSPLRFYDTDLLQPYPVDSS